MQTVQINCGTTIHLNRVYKTYSLAAVGPMFFFVHGSWNWAWDFFALPVAAVNSPLLRVRMKKKRPMTMVPTHKQVFILGKQDRTWETYTQSVMHIITCIIMSPHTRDCKHTCQVCNCCWSRFSLKTAGLCWVWRGRDRDVGHSEVDTQLLAECVPSVTM